MSSIICEALLLKVTPFRESDAVVELITCQLGKVSLMARGARRSRKRFGGALDYLCLFNAELTRPNTGMGRLNNVELLGSFNGTRNDVERFTAAGHMLDVMRMATREGDPSSEPFDLLRGALNALEALPSNAQIGQLILIFRIKVVALLGYALGGGYCSGCGGELGRGEVGFDDLAPICADCAPQANERVSAGAFKTLAAAEKAANGRLGSLRVSAPVAAELEPLVKRALVRALGGEPRTLN